MSENPQVMSSFLHFSPQYETAPFGGRWLAESLLRPRLLEGPAAASLEFSSDPGRALTVEEGALSGKGMAELIRSSGEEVLGPRGLASLQQGRVLEIRFLAADTAGTPLFFSRPTSPPAPPTALILLETRPGARIFLGRRKHLSAERFLGLWRTSPAEEILESHPAEAGQVILAPAGLPYALGRGILAYEVRMTLTASPPLPSASRTKPYAGLITASVPSSRLFVPPRGAVTGKNAIAWLYATEFFTTVRLDLRGEWEEGAPEGGRGGFLVLTGIHGRALLSAAEETETLERGKTIIVSSRTEVFRINPAAEGAVIFKTWLADPLTDIENPLRRLGFSAAEIEALYGGSGTGRRGG